MLSRLGWSQTSTVNPQWTNYTNELQCWLGSARRWACSDTDLVIPTASPTTYWPYTNHMPTPYWPYADHVTDHIPTTPTMLPTIYWPHTGHILAMLLTKYWPCCCPHYRNKRRVRMWNFGRFWQASTIAKKSVLTPLLHRCLLLVSHLQSWSKVMVHLAILENFTIPSPLPQYNVGSVCSKCPPWSNIVWGGRGEGMVKLSKKAKFGKKSRFYHRTGEDNEKKQIFKVYHILLTRIVVVKVVCYQKVPQ